MATNVQISTLVSRERTAAILGLSVRSVDRLRERGRLPGVQIVPGGRVRYRLEDVEALLEPEVRAVSFRADPRELEWH
jgi:hypothetical protein